MALWLTIGLIWVVMGCYGRKSKFADACDLLDLSLIFRLRPLSAYSGQAFYPKLAHFYPRRPVAFWQNSLTFIHILPQVGIVVG